MAKAASKSQEPNRCRMLLHLGLVGARGRRLSRDSSPGRHCGVGAADLAAAADTALLPETVRNKNWDTVCDKCPQINVKFKWHTF